MDKEKKLDLLNGDVKKVLILFALPFVYANILQALYGAVDLFVIGRFCDSSAVSAVGIGTEIKVGETADLTVYDLNENYNIDSSTFVSMGKATPFDGNNVYGKCKLTLCAGKEVYKDM